MAAEAKGPSSQCTLLERTSQSAAQKSEVHNEHGAESHQGEGRPAGTGKQLGSDSQVCKIKLWLGVENVASIWSSGLSESLKADGRKRSNRPRCRPVATADVREKRQRDIVRRTTSPMPFALPLPPPHQSAAARDHALLPRVVVVVANFTNLASAACILERGVGVVPAGTAHYAKGRKMNISFIDPALDLVAHLVLLKSQWFFGFRLEKELG